MTGKININVCNEIYNSIEEIETEEENNDVILDNSDSISNEDIYDNDLINN